MFGGSHLGVNGPLAKAFWLFNVATNQMTECDIERNLDKNWSDTPSAQNNTYDIESVALHEFGHCAGLWHSADSTAVMYFQLITGQTKRNLLQDDINGIRTIYGP